MKIITGVRAVSDCTLGQGMVIVVGLTQLVSVGGLCKPDFIAVTRFAAPTLNEI